MMSYGQLLLLILPVFGLIGIGVGVRRIGWMTAAADTSLLKMVVSCFYPCLVFESVLNNEALRNPSNLAFAPLVGFCAMTAGILVAFYAGRAFGLTRGHGLRTFAFATGINNYGYIPILLMGSLFPGDGLGVLLVHNVGCEAAIWTVGILVLSGLSLREGWRKLINGPVIALLVGVAGNLLNLGPKVPRVVMDVIHQCAVCSIPLGLILIGATLEQYFRRPKELFDARVSVFSTLLRLGVFPFALLALAKYLPCSLELKHVLVLQAAMPAGILPIVIAAHYGGQPLTAVRVVIATTVVGIFLIPLWLRVGIAWIP